MPRKSKPTPTEALDPVRVAQAQKWVDAYHAISYAFPQLPTAAVIAATDYVMTQYV